ncbi:hypothetical protein YC2023_123737 [Brassica napus]
MGFIGLFLVEVSDRSQTGQRRMKTYSASSPLLHGIISVSLIETEQWMRKLYVVYWFRFWLRWVLEHTS